MHATPRKKSGVAVGAGYFSQYHLEAWGRLAEVDLLAVCDRELQKASQAAAKYSIGGVYSNVTQMLDAEQPDFIDIITRPDSHLEMVQLAAERGIDVICQKPLAPTQDEAKLIVQVAAHAGIRLMVHENFRFQPWHREIKKLLRQGIIGDRLHSISCRSRLGDGWQEDAYLARQPYFVTMPQLLIYETGVHFIDTYRYLAGEIDGVFASLRKLNEKIAGEDAGIVLFEFVEGARGLWDASRYHESNYDDPRYTFGSFTLEGNDGTIRLCEDGRLTVQPLGRPEHDILYPHARRNFASDCVFATQQHFIHSLLQQQPFETSGEDYLQNLRIQAAIYQSAETGQAIRGLTKSCA